MKFAMKLMFSVTIVVSLLFSAGGIYFVEQNFNHSLDMAAEQNSNQHMLQKYAIESNMLGYLLSGENYSDEKLSEYATRVSGYAENMQKYMGIFYRESQPIYSTLPALEDGNVDEAIGKGGGIYLIRKVEEKTYMLFTSALEIKDVPAYMVNAYDISALLAERDRQLSSFLLLNGILIMVSVVLVGILAWFLTRPIAKLNRVSNRIAAGSYEERTDIKSDDEIGELSRSFDTMIETIKNNIQSLEASIQQRDDFVAAFSHEIKTPMTSIVGFADLLRTGIVDAENQFQYASVIYDDARRLENLSRRLMELMGISEETIQLNRLSTEQLFARIESHAADYQEVVLTYDIEPAEIIGDEDLLDCLIGNLISNGRKAHPQDGRIYLSGSCSGSGYQIVVSDYGCGIPPEEILRITEPFYMIDKSRARSEGGSGLGLFLCQKIAKLHQTELVVASQLGKGTSVTIELSLAVEGGENK